MKSTQIYEGFLSSVGKHYTKLATGIVSTILGTQTLFLLDTNVWSNKVLARE